MTIPTNAATAPTSQVVTPFSFSIVSTYSSLSTEPTCPPTRIIRPPIPTSLPSPTLHLCNPSTEPTLFTGDLLSSLLSDTVDYFLVGLRLRALGIDVPPAVWATILLSINLAILLPSTPGHLGVLEAGAVFALSTAGVAPEPALAFALVYHAVHLVPPTALGVVAISPPLR